MPYNAAAIANELLDSARRAGRAVTQIEIQKLVYFAQGWYLGIYHQPLFVESIEAWQYGPVVRELYTSFRRFGSRPITDKAVQFVVGLDGYMPTTPALPPEDQLTRSFVEAVYKQYGTLAAFKLVELTHATGSPWEIAWTKGQNVILNSDIEHYFSGLAAQNAANIAAGNAAVVAAAASPAPQQGATA